MYTAAKWALSIAVGGLALGALLGDAANPRMKDPVPQWWQLTGQDEDQTFASADGLTIEAGPDDLNPFSGYRPDLDYDAEAWEQIPEYELSAPAYDPYATAVEPEVEQAAGEAEAATRDALAKAVEAAPAEPRRAELSASGIY